MKVVIQRVSEASVSIDGRIKSTIGRGLLILLGIEQEDGEEDINWLCAKISKLRIFNDEQGAMNLSAADLGGEFLVVSQFTLHASTKKGNRPSFINAAKPDTAIPLYHQFLNRLEKETGQTIHSGEFGADMKVHLINDGPVTIIIDSRNKE
ncbi:MAG: D-tyrosyl-tRNA(Tyr) deacylase [Flavobacteriales bacterium]|nr:D-tyrosyl-tRNA(Tyr) deacylase [Flavobacteriales bacterium]